MSKCLNAPILIAVPIREAIPEADPALGLQDQAVLVLGDHLALVRVDLVVLVMMIGVHRGIGLRVEILVIVLLVVMIAVRMIGPLVVILVIVPRVAMIGALTTVRLVVMIGVRMIGPHVATALALVGRLVRAVMTVVMAGDEAVPVKKTLLPASRVMRRSAGVQQFVPVVVVPFVRI